jgi:23S rRNA (cytidine1920-2'-O)/16S rRNA (cytidine1409-2'-O)-methyltransferase
MEKTRLDQLLVERGLVESRERAQRLIRAGLVVVGEQRVDKPGTRVAVDSPLRLKGDFCPYVSRGGLKLAGAIERFGLKDGLAGVVALDVGASTGGFTDCLLAHGARFVWAVDTGRGQLHEKLRQDPRVRLRENANARALTPEWLEGERVDVVVVDVSFISLRLVLPPLTAILKPGGAVLALVKPQFEAGVGDVGRNGVVRDRRVHRRVLTEIVAFARGEGWSDRGLCVSPLPGPAGNVEFFLWLTRADHEENWGAAADQIAIERVLDEAYTLLKPPPVIPEGGVEPTGGVATEAAESPRP